MPFNSLREKNIRCYGHQGGLIRTNQDFKAHTTLTTTEQAIRMTLTEMDLTPQVDISLILPLAALFLQTNSKTRLETEIIATEQNFLQ